MNFVVLTKPCEKTVGPSFYLSHLIIHGCVISQARHGLCCFGRMTVNMGNSFFFFNGG